MKKFLTVLLTFTLYFNLTTQANAAVGGWSLGSPVASGASAIVNGTKEIILNGASKIAKGTAKITPNAAQVANVLKRGAAGYALSVAVEQLIGSVSWVLDPANNRIVWKEGGTSAGTYIFLCSDSINGCSSNSSMIFQRPYLGNISEEASKLCSAYAASLGGVKHPNSNTSTCIVTVSDNNRFYGISTRTIAGEEEQEKSIPLETVAQQVISNAAGGDVSAQQAITAAAQDVINEAENDSVKAAPIVQQLEASKAIEAENTATGEQTQNPDKPNVTNIKLEFPAFCGWAPLVCEAAQTVISFPVTLTSWWNTANQKADSWANSISQSWAEAKEWATSEKNEDTELDIPDQEQPDIDTDIAFGGMCPDDRQAEINMGVGVIKMPISYEPICTTVSTAKPVLIFVGFFVAALIIGGVKTE